MAYYLQPGGARTKLSNDEKNWFLLKVQNLSKPIIAQCLTDALSAPDNTIVMVQPSNYK